MPEINLAPSGAKKLKATSKKINLICLSISAVVVIGVFSVYLFIFLKNKNKISERDSLKETVDELDGINKELDSVTLTFKEQVKNTDILLRNHVYFSRVLEDVEKTAVPSIWYDKIEANIEENEVIFTGKAFDISSISKQLASFVGNENLASVNVSGAIGKNEEKDDNAYEFSVRASYKDNFITKNKK